MDSEKKWDKLSIWVQLFANNENETDKPTKITRKSIQIN